MANSPRGALVLVYAVIVLGMWVLPAQPAHSQSQGITFTCGAAAVSGTIGVHLEVVFPLVSTEHDVFTQTVNVQAGSASAKCAAIAEALNNTPGNGVSAIATGNMVTLFGLGGPSPTTLYAAGLESDTTMEFTTVSSDLPSGQEVRIIEFLGDPSVIPPEDFYSGFFEYTPLFGTFGTSANGVDDAAAVLGALNDNFANEFGIQFQPPTTLGNAPVQFSDWFDPTTVAIGWDGNTALYLANFAIEFQPSAPAPEPATLALLGIGLAGLGFSRRIRDQ